MKPSDRSQWSDGKNEVLIRSEIQILNLGATIPAGSYARVIRRIASDAAEVEWRGTRWVEIFIADSDDAPNSVDVCANQLREQAKVMSTAKELETLKNQIAQIRAIAEPLAANRKYMQLAGPMRQILNIIKTPQS
jgi:hypothetical protein